MEWLKSLLTGAVGAGIIAGIFQLVQWGLSRKAAKSDRAEDRKVMDCAARGRELEDLKKQVDVLMLADRTLLYARIKSLAKEYIQRGNITVEELEDLDRMHGVYHDPDKLNGNGFLDGVMKTVHKLPMGATPWAEGKE